MLRQRPPVELVYTQDDLVYDSGEVSSLILICSLQHIPKSNISKTTKKTAMWNSLFLTVIGEETILIFRRRM